MTQRTPGEEAEREVLAAIGRWALEHVLMNRVELADQMFNDVVKQYNGRWPHHKILSNYWQSVREPKEMGDVCTQPPLLTDQGTHGPE